MNIQAIHLLCFMKSCSRVYLISIILLVFYLPIGACQMVCGLNFVAPPSPFKDNPMVAVTAVNANWISVIPYAFTPRDGNPIVRHDTSGGQLWGESPDGIRKTIRLAHEEGLKVMLKPQIYIPGSWPGALSFATDSNWEKWETAYQNYIQIYVNYAVKYDIEAFCIGTEFRESIRKRPAFWSKLITHIRSTYSGSLTYASNWDDYYEVPFWSELDVIGIDAYFPISQLPNPDLSILIMKWDSIMKVLSKFAEQYDKKILFTEYGYLSVEGAAGKNWELERDIKSRPISEVAQRDALEALLTTCEKYPVWIGGFLWKWFPEGKGHEGYIERDYTPQGKLSEETLTRLFKMHTL